MLIFFVCVLCESFLFKTSKPLNDKSIQIMFLVLKQKINFRYLHTNTISLYNFLKIITKIKLSTKLSTKQRLYKVCFDIMSIKIVYKTKNDKICDIFCCLFAKKFYIVSLSFNLMLHFKITVFLWKYCFCK